MTRILAISFLILAALPAGAADGPQTSFFRGNSLYAEGNYAEAIAAYESLAAEGYDGGHLRFNLGNSWFKAGDIGRAILNYERAESWIPDDPDLDANLSHARSVTGAEPCEPPVWAGLLFPLAPRFSTWTLAVLASALFVLLLTSLALRRVLTRPRRVFGYAAGLCGAALLVAAGSAGYRYARVDRPSYAVVVAAGDTPVRFEPATDGTTHFVAKQGTRLAVGDSRTGWTQVVRCDGRRGWIEAETIAAL